MSNGLFDNYDNSGLDLDILPENARPRPDIYVAEPFPEDPFDSYEAIEVGCGTDGRPLRLNTVLPDDARDRNDHDYRVFETESISGNHFKILMPRDLIDDE